MRIFGSMSVSGAGRLVAAQLAIPGALLRRKNPGLLQVRFEVRGAYIGL